MDNFLRYFYADIGQVFQAFVDLIAAIGNFLNYLLNFPMRMDNIKKYYQEFVFGKICTATYQQYPMKSHQKMMLLEKIAALEKEVIN